VEGDYQRVFPIPFNKKFGINIIYQPFFTQQLGVFSQTELTPDVINDFLLNIPQKYKVVDLNLNIHNKPDAPGFTYSPQINHELDLIGDYEVIRKGYSSNTRRNLQKAEKSGLFFQKELKPDEIIDLFRANRGKDIKVLKDANYLKIRRLMYTCIYQDMGSTYGVYSGENELLAGAVFLQSNKKSVFIFSGMSPEGREKRAMFFLIDQFIRQHSNKHLTLDFDGSNDEALSRFYKGFGSTRIDFMKISRNTLPTVLKIPFKYYRSKKSS
jgi:hypothetical protein